MYSSRRLMAERTLAPPSRPPRYGGHLPSQLGEEELCVVHVAEIPERRRGLREAEREACPSKVCQSAAAQRRRGGGELALSGGRLEV